MVLRISIVQNEVNCVIAGVTLKRHVKRCIEASKLCVSMPESSFLHLLFACYLHSCFIISFLLYFGMGVIKYTSISSNKCAFQVPLNERESCIQVNKFSVDFFLHICSLSIYLIPIILTRLRTSDVNGRGRKM